VKNEYNGDYLGIISLFDNITEDKLRNILRSRYMSLRSADQAWKTCKGELYEYAVFKCINNVVFQDNMLKERLKVIAGNKVILYKDKIVIRNWGEIYPDTDIIIVDKDSKSIKGSHLCKF